MRPAIITLCNVKYRAPRMLISSPKWGTFEYKNPGLSTCEFFGNIKRAENNCLEDDANLALQIFFKSISGGNHDFEEDYIEWIEDFCPELAFQDVLFSDWKECTFNPMQDDCMIMTRD